MISKILFLSLFLSFGSMASSEKSLCVTNAQCQNHTDESTACFLVKSGDPRDGETCEKRCYTVYTGSYCKFFKDKSYGECAEEDYKNPNLKPTKASCKKAIPQEAIRSIFNF
jgi:hypothetical protein